MWWSSRKLTQHVVGRAVDQGWGKRRNRPDFLRIWLWVGCPQAPSGPAWLAIYGHAVTVRCMMRRSREIFKLGTKAQGVEAGRGAGRGRRRSDGGRDPLDLGWPRSPPLRGEALDLQLVLLSVPQHRHPAARRPVVLPRAVAAPHRGGPALGLRPGDPGTAIVVDADDVPDHRDGSGDEGALLEREVRPQGQQHGGAHAEPHRGEAGALLHETGARGSGARGAIGPKDYTATWVAASPGGGTPTARRSSRAPG